ncbi:ribonucleases P/MRP protein subunit POP1 isoform X2 [Humulus lupulus]|uniref:ribonucleases P/MRP protein subunit POP1 isoform X2 n=1 Tax=Humulus lupulus TaxID=3486 RepID=UPI002B411E39|nr:ribonucleases P/MRP protein subunit POP1 isoform X2 [Humulus lupulus]
MGTNGGTKRLQLSAPSQPPQKINVQKFAESRTGELESLHSIVGNRLEGDFRSRRSKRRRTTSFNSKAAKRRRKVQGRNLDDEKKKNKNDNENISIPRRIRRRAQMRINPEEGFSVSQDGTKRLRTHVWYAKRFTMTKLWGYYLPLGLHGSGRGSRALLKWFRNAVLIHDASYNVAVQLEGPEGSLLSILSTVLVPSPSVCPGDVSNSVISGAIYDYAVLHHIGAPVSKPIAPVTYMWRPCSLRNRDGDDASINGLGSMKPEITESRSSFRQLWVWIHASAFDEGYGALKFACEKEMEEKDILIHCFSREGQLAKLEVMGSKAFELLQKALPVTWISEDSQQVEKHSVAEADNGSQLRKNCVLQNEDHISSKAMLSLSVMDPRTITKKGMIPNVPGNEIGEHTGIAEISDRCKESFPLSSEPGSNGTLTSRNLWDASSGVIPPVEESILCKEKHELQKKFFFLDGPTSTEVQCSRCCPTMLLKDKNKEGLAIGWSVVLPLSWVRAFWVPLVSKGAHAIGLREKHWVACEVGLPCFPSDFPDCNAYSSLKATEAVASNLKEELHPLSTRPLRVPILPPWDSVRVTLNRLLTTVGDPIICREGKHDDSNSTSNMDSASCDARLHGHCTSLDSFVARTSSLLTNFLNEVKGDHLLLFPRIANKKKSFSKVAKDESKLGQGQNGITNIIWNRKLCFLRVLLRAYKEGSFEEGAVICAPRPTDISLWTLSSVNIEGGLQIPQSAVTSYFKEESSGKWELQMPEDTTASESHRMPVGFVTTGFVRGSKKPMAEAFCEAVLLAHLRKEQWDDPEVKRRKKEIYVLVRNLRSTAYRLALATIVLEHQVEDVEFL